MKCSFVPWKRAMPNGRRVLMTQNSRPQTKAPFIGYTTRTWHKYMWMTIIEVASKSNRRMRIAALLRKIQRATRPAVMMRDHMTMKQM